jgi:hypothetical protein
VTSRVDGHESVHLHLPAEMTSLCGIALPRHEQSSASFRTRGCLACLAIAHECGYSVARDREQTWINLARMQPTA